MLQYLIILLDDTSVSFCHHENMKTDRYPMPIDILKEGIKFGMKENLRIQFVLPNYTLPQEYWQEMMSVDHTIIAPGNIEYNSLVPKNVFYQLPDVVVFDDVDPLLCYPIKKSQSYVLRIGKQLLFSNLDNLSDLLYKISRLNICITDIETFTDTDFDQYKRCLTRLSNIVYKAYSKGYTPQVNILTDRMMLKEMNNCNAGVSSITLAPDGKYYICPAFYQSESSTPIQEDFDIGTLKKGINIRNQQLYKIEYAPLCRNCDAYQCKRCIWLNNKITYEVNTPSHEQCVISHLERNASRKLLNELREMSPSFLENMHIKEINYLDPFDVKQEL